MFKLFNSGTSEGASEGWATRRQGAYKMSDDAHKMTSLAREQKTSSAHLKAAEAHSSAAKEHNALFMGGPGENALEHAAKESYHKAEANWHIKEADAYATDKDDVPWRKHGIPYTKWRIGNMNYTDIVKKARLSNGGPGSGRHAGEGRHLKSYQAYGKMAGMIGNSYSALVSKLRNGGPGSGRHPGPNSGPSHNGWSMRDLHGSSFALVDPDAHSSERSEVLRGAPKFSAMAAKPSEHAMMREVYDNIRQYHENGGRSGKAAEAESRMKYHEAHAGGKTVNTYRDIIRKIRNGGPGSGRHPGPNANLDDHMGHIMAEAVGGEHANSTKWDGKGIQSHFHYINVDNPGRAVAEAHTFLTDDNNGLDGITSVSGPKSTKSGWKISASNDTQFHHFHFHRKEPNEDVVDNSSGICVELTGTKLANRAFQTPPDNWYHIAPKGEHPHPTKIVQILDDKSINSMVANFQNRKNSDPKFPGVLVDYDHVSQDGSTEAAGWIDNLQARNDGLWAHINWSDEGQKAINGGRYRLVSPVWKKSECEKLGDSKLRPLVLDSIAVTNEPNLRGLTPLSK